MGIKLFLSMFLDSYLNTSGTLLGPGLNKITRPPVKQNKSNHIQCLSLKQDCIHMTESKFHERVK